MSAAAEAAAAADVAALEAADVAALWMDDEGALPNLVRPVVWRFHAQDYSARPNLWRNGPDQMRCDAVHDRIGDEVTWNTSLAIAEAINCRTDAALRAVCDDVYAGKVDLRSVDCYLPVLERPHRHCISCGHHTSRRSVIALWISAVGTYGIATVGWGASRVSLLFRFFWCVIVPSGFAVRFNEPVACRGRTALEYAFWTEDRDLTTADEKVLLGCPTTILLTCVPRDIGLDIESYTTRFMSRFGPSGDTILTRLAEFARSADQLKFRDAFIVVHLNALLPCGRSCVPDRGWVKTLTPAQIVLMFI